MNKYILHIAQNYSFEILRPIQKEILARGQECVWYVMGRNVELSRFKEGEVFILSEAEIANYDAIAVFTPGNVVPDFIKGLKVQVFHGLEWKKKGHFRIRDFFDLYCTHGPITTAKFQQLAKKHKNFLVKETGWSKLDPLFSTAPYKLETDRPVILYAPTFSKNLTSAEACFDEISRLAKVKDWFWLIKFHPLMDKEWVEKYRKLEEGNVNLVENHSVLPLLRRADVMLSDTSSVVGEFLLQGKPVVTFNNSQPESSLINILDAHELEAAIEKGLAAPKELMSAIDESNAKLHPYNDGQSSARLLDAVDEILNTGLRPRKKRPLNVFRNYKIRKNLKYWRNILG